MARSKKKIRKVKCKLCGRWFMPSRMPAHYARAHGTG